MAKVVGPRGNSDKKIKGKPKKSSKETASEDTAKLIRRLKLSEKKLQKANRELLQLLGERGTESSPAVSGGSGISGRKKSESALQEALRFNNQVLENMRDGVIVYGPDLRYRVWNSAMEKLSGMPASEVLGRHPEELFPFLKDAGVIDMVRDSLVNGTTRTIDFPYNIPHFNRSGWTSDTSGPLRDTSGAIVGVITTVREITDRKSTEEERRVSEERFRTLATLAPAGIYLTDSAGRCTYANNRWLEMAGMGLDEALGDGWARGLHPDDAPGVFANWRKMVASEGRWGHEYRFRTPGGVVTWVSGRAASMQDKNGAVIGYVGINSDITDRKKAEEALTKSEAYYRGLFDHMLEGYAYCKMLYEHGRPIDWIYLSVNPAFEQLTGLKDIAGKRVTEIIPGIREADPELFDRYGRVASTGNHEKFEMYVEALMMWFHVSVFCPEMDHFVAVFDVITERKRAEEKLLERTRFSETLIDLSPSIIYIYDLIERKNIYSNDGVQKFLGYSAGEIQAMGSEIIPLLMHPEDFQVYVTKTVPRYATAKDGQLIVHQYRMKHKSGGWRWFSSSELIYRRFSDGSPQQIFGMMLDMTERIKAEEALKSSEERWRLSINNMLEGYALHEAIYDDNGRMVDYRFLEFNPAAQKIANIARDQIFGKTALELYPHIIERGLMAKYAAVMATGEPVYIEDFYYAGDKLDKAFDISCFRIDSRHFVCVFRDITERKKALEALMRSEEKYRTVADFTYDWEYWMGPDGRLLYCSPSCKRITGISAQEFILDPSLLISIVHPEDRDKVEHHQKKDYSTATVDHEAEFRIINRAGEVFWISHACQCVYSADGVYIGRRASNRDITERKRAENTLRSVSQRLQLATQSARLGVWDWDVVNNEMTWDDRMLELYGHTSESFPGGIAAWERGLHPEDRDRAWEECQLALRGERPWDTEFKVLHPDGTVLHLKADGAVIRDNDGKPVRMLGINSDITERKKAEEELRHAKEYTETLVRTASIMIVGLDASGSITVFNRTAEKITGYTMQELQGKNWFEVLVPKDRYPQVWDEFTRLVSTGIPDVYENHILTKFGEERLIAWRNSEIRENGRVTGTISFGIDITEHRKMEELLRQSQKMEAIGILAGGIAHDFNNLLQGIVGSISLAKMLYEQKEKSLAMLEHAEQALHMAVGLTTQLLTFSKGGMPVKKTISPRPVIENAIRFGLSGSKCKYAMSFEDNLWMTEADEGQIGQVIQNIVINADQAMPEGGNIAITAANVHVTAKDSVGFAERKYVKISIEDSGIGIPEKYLQKIFDPYFTTKEKGSGLGLATSYSIVKNHGGIIDVSSEVGAGTTFVIYLPATEEKPDIQAPEAISSETRKGRILVMDDEEMIRNIAREQISFLGHEVELANDGQMAIRTYKNAKESGRPFDMVILDLTIRGGIGGEETLRRLLEIDPGVKAIVSSGYSGDFAVSDYMKSGFKAVLKKPYRIEALSDTISTLLK